MNSYPNRIAGSLLVLLLLVVAIRNAWMSDDAYITLRTVNHLLQGFGPVWNVGERVQAYTHPLWMLVLSGAILFSREFYYTPLLLSLFLSSAAFYVVVARVAVDWQASLLAGTLLLLSKAFVDYTTSGLENPLTYLLLALVLFVYLRRPHSMRWLVIMALLAGLSAVNRLDILLLLGPPLLWTAYALRNQWRQVAGAAAIGLLPLLAWELFAIIYYGFPAPNTAYAKLNTGIPAAALIEQGLLFLMESLSTDPLTLTAIVAAMSLPWLRRSGRTAAIAAGMALYLLYIVSIGGDFMTGRFLSVPLLCAAVIVARQPLATLPRMQTTALFVVVIFLGFANPTQSPWLSNATYNVAAIDNRGIADERGHYYQRYGLLPSDRYNRDGASGEMTGSLSPHMYGHCGIGYIGFVASPYTQIVDFCGLADALIARLPAIAFPDWRIGHPIRRIPDGYMGTLRTGENRISDPALAEYYVRLQRVIKGPLFAADRWTEIWRFNSGQNDYLIDRSAHQYPDMKRAAWEAFDRNWPEHLAYIEDSGATSFRGMEFGYQGITIDLGARQHATWIDLGARLPAFDAVFLDGSQTVGRQSVSAQPLVLGADMVAVLRVPAAAAQRGYTALRIIPQRSGDYHLTRVALWEESLVGAHVADLLRLFYHVFYRSERDTRALQLAALEQAIRARPEREWADVPVRYYIDLLKMPAPALQELAQARLPGQKLLADEAGASRLRYLGAVDEPLTAEDQEPGARLRLYFEALDPFDRDYTIWFHIANTETGAEYMLYDYTSLDGTTTWPAAMIFEAPIFLALEPGAYEISFGFWTPASRDRLYVEGSDVYWINLGIHQASVPETASP
ncbi:MAG: hypothetical protein H3C34_08635 [Caldilineaceae bacterium]|nr:hypothetical protein [Caldilineaceae bacterium]